MQRRLLVANVAVDVAKEQFVPTFAEAKGDF
jgi:hypothetical protein